MWSRTRPSESAGRPPPVTNPRIDQEEDTRPYLAINKNGRPIPSARAWISGKALILAGSASPSADRGAGSDYGEDHIAVGSNAKGNPSTSKNAVIRKKLTGSAVALSDLDVVSNFGKSRRALNGNGAGSANDGETLLPSSVTERSSVGFVATVSAKGQTGGGAVTWKVLEGTAAGAAVVSSSAVSSTDKSPVTHILGVIGVLQPPGGTQMRPELLCIRSAVLAGVFRDSQTSHRIYRITRVVRLPVPGDAAFDDDVNLRRTASLSPLSSQSGSTAVTGNSADIGIFRRVDELFEVTGGFYFCRTFDMLTRLQHQAGLSSADLSRPLVERCDSRFFWNERISEAAVKAGAGCLVVPVFQGHVSHFSQRLGLDIVDFLLISRRGKDRAGTRYNARGADGTGAVANFVETEQIISVVAAMERLETAAQPHKTFVGSFVQTRGNVPLLWRQRPRFRQRKPEVEQQGTFEQNNVAFGRHAKHHQETYGSTLCINLLDADGLESRLRSSFSSFAQSLAKEATMSSSPSFVYMEFDFHSECSGGKFENVSKLITRLQAQLISMRYFLCSLSSGKVESVIETQSGVFRTNCLDCLDRTNVVQSALAKEGCCLMLRSVLPDITKAGGEIFVCGTFSQIFKECWADSGDAISKFYAGTNALKGDFTRTGKRNAKGLMNDGVNSVTRHVKNNFSDKWRQIAIDLSRGGSLASGTSAPKSPAVQSTIGMTQMIVLRCAELVLNHPLIATDSDQFIEAHLMTYSGGRFPASTNDHAVLLLTDTTLAICVIVLKTGDNLELHGDPLVVRLTDVADIIYDSGPACSVCLIDKNGEPICPTLVPFEGNFECLGEQFVEFCAVLELALKEESSV